MNLPNSRPTVVKERFRKSGCNACYIGTECACSFTAKMWCFGPPDLAWCLDDLVLVGICGIRVCFWSMFAENLIAPWGTQLQRK